MTLSPYLGEDGLEPFYEIAKRDGKGIFICVRNSNSGAGMVIPPFITEAKNRELSS